MALAVTLNEAYGTAPDGSRGRHPETTTVVEGVQHAYVEPYTQGLSRQERLMCEEVPHRIWKSTPQHIWGLRYDKRVPALSVRHRSAPSRYEQPVSSR